MGTKIYRESYLPGYQYQSARSTNETATNRNWSLFFGNKTMQNGQQLNGILPRTVTNFVSGYEKDALKQMMLSHEAAFKHQVSELHRVYKVQREMMSEIKRKELYKHPIPIETPPSSSSLVHIASYEDALMRWHKSPIPEIDSKARKRLFDLHIPADKYIDVEDKISDILSKDTTQTYTDSLGGRMQAVYSLGPQAINSCTRNDKADLGIGAMLDSKIQLFDLNEPFVDDDVDDLSNTNFLEKSNNGKELIIDMNSAGHTEPRLDSNFGANTTFSKLLSDEILKANISCNKKEINTRGVTNSSLITHTIGNKSIDINLICEVDAEVADRETEKRHIDLNMCASEDEITLVPSSASTSIDVKIAMDIDIEVPDSEDEADTLAAIAIVGISSVEDNTEDPSEGSLEQALLWFSEAICTSDFEKDIDICTNKHTEKHTNSLGGRMQVIYSLGSHHIQESMVQICSQPHTDTDCNVSDEIDEFEAMTLRLTEFKEEEYMPSPLVSENMELETETETNLPIRTRRGKIKRQKRDFQREILPGMSSLSRHEVAEDVQTFSGILKAMGSSWPVLGKRNGGGGRGRRRLVAEVAPLVEPKVTFKPLMERINSVEIGWGKTPRRPRRRRCNAGNLSSIKTL